MPSKGFAVQTAPGASRSVENSVMMMEVMCRRQSDNPQSHHQRADREDPSADWAILRSKR